MSNSTHEIKEREFIDKFIRMMKPQLTEEEIVGTIAIISGYIRGNRIDYAKEKCKELTRSYSDAIKNAKIGIDNIEKLASVSFE